jgi:CDP-diacylglycerol--glycerol-3-phosphate 3-phosphatidyltransferase
VNARIPNALTVGRIVITPVMVVALAMDTRDGDYIAAVVFAIASITDFVDGWLARRADVISAFGKLMDPIADKLLVVGALLPLVARDRLAWWVAAVIIAREALVTLTRMRVKRRGGEVIAAAQLGKLKTVVQLWAILFVILFDPTPLWVDLVVWAAVLLTVVSAADFYWRTYRGAPAPATAAAPPGEPAGPQ